jgi:dynein heavy chain
MKPEDGHPELTYKNQVCKSKIGYIECNFDRHLEKLMHETAAWKKLASFGAVVPNYADEFTTVHRENLRVLKEYVMLVVRDQNRIKDYMDSLEQKLFKGHMDLVDQQIRPGLLKLKWSSKGILEKFVFDSRKMCNEIYQKLKMFKSNTEKIDAKCTEIASKVLIKLEKKKAVEIDKFERD